MTKALSGHHRAALITRGGLFFAAIIMALFVQLVPAGRAFADSLHNCSAGDSLYDYVNTYHCAFSSSTYLSALPGQWLTANVYINLSVQPPIPTNMVADIKTALNNWRNATPNLVEHYVNSTDYANVIEFVPDPCGFYNNDYTNPPACDFQNTPGCGGYWGDTNDSAFPHIIMLNEYRFSCSDTVWTDIAAHEFGHAVGLGHNTNCSPQCQLMNPGPTVATPQSIDLYIYNLIYPNALCSVIPSDCNCNNQDYKQEQCNSYAQGGAFSGGIITVTLYYSTNCQSNWTLATLHDTTDYTLYQVDIERQSSYAPTSLLETAQYNSWYTNMLWAPNFKARGCAWIVINNTTDVLGPYCSS